MHRAEKVAWWAKGDVPIGAEPELISDFRTDESWPSLATHSATVALPVLADDSALIVAAFAFVLGRASIHHESDGGKEMLLGLLHAPSEQDRLTTWNRGTKPDALLLSPVRVLVDESRSLLDLRDACELDIASARAHALPLDALRLALGRTAMPTGHSEPSPAILVRCTLLFDADSRTNAAANALFARFGGAAPDVQLRVHRTPAQATSRYAMAAHLSSIPPARCLR